MANILGRLTHSGNVLYHKQLNNAIVRDATLPCAFVCGAASSGAATIGHLVGDILLLEALLRWAIYSTSAATSGHLVGNIVLLEALFRWAI